MAIITPEQVAAAYAALATGQRDQIVQMLAEDMRWLVPGHNQLSGWKNNVDEFIAFMAAVGRLSENSFRMDPVVVMTADNYSADVTHNLGHRAGDPNRILDIDVIHCDIQPGGIRRIAGSASRQPDPRLADAATRRSHRRRCRAGTCAEP